MFFFIRSVWLWVTTGHGKVLIPALFAAPLHPRPFTGQHLQATGRGGATNIVFDDTVVIVGLVSSRHQFVALTWVLDWFALPSWSRSPTSPRGWTGGHLHVTARYGGYSGMVVRYGASSLFFFVMFFVAPLPPPSRSPFLFGTTVTWSPVGVTGVVWF